jgi:hypothetical protein
VGNKCEGARGGTKVGDVTGGRREAGWKTHVRRR